MNNDKLFPDDHKLLYDITLDALFRTGVIQNVDHFKDKHRMRCPVCGDSKKNKYLKRGWLIYNPAIDLSYYCCHNGGCEAGDNMGTKKLLLKIDAGELQRYKKEIFSRGSGTSSKVLKFSNNKSKDFIKKEKEKLQRAKDATKTFLSLSNQSNSHEYILLAKEYCESRLIPEESSDKFYVSVSGKYDGRLIIPFPNDKGEVKFFAARSLKGQTPKYLYPELERNIDSLYGYHSIDKSKPVMITEGILDSIFLENGVAQLGVSTTEQVEAEFKKNCEHRYYLFDNDKPGYDASIKKLHEGEYVFLWKKFIDKYSLQFEDIKDINDFILFSKVKKKISFDILKPFFTNKIFDKVYLK